jgi:hypothetical protein
MDFLRIRKLNEQEQLEEINRIMVAGCIVWGVAMLVLAIRMAFT